MSATAAEQPTAAAPPTFDAIALSAEMRRAVDEMGFVTPTPVQLETFGPACDGKDLIVQAQTGTGKTAAFGMPLLDRVIRAGAGTQMLVLTPTRELALQVGRELEKLGRHAQIRMSAVYGGAPMDRQIRELAQGAEVVSGTPGRVLDHLRRGTLDPRNIRALVLDEADEMLSMGFAKELNSIIELLPEKRQTLCFSATVDDDVKRLASRHMKEATFLTLSSDAVGARGVTHFVYWVSGKDRARDLVRILEVEDPESALIFCNTKVETERVAQELSAQGFSADWLNGDLPQSEREAVMARTRAGQLRYLVATDVAARGIDISHLTHVINFALPESAEQYVHRTGRTGRAGRTGTAIALVAPSDLGALYYLRLQFKIFPIERSLPSEGELRTRQEADRIAMITGALVSEPSELDRAVARRLLTHPDAERLLSGLLAAFFGARGADVDEQAAAGRRARPPAPAPMHPARESRGTRRGGAVGRDEPAENREPRGRARPQEGSVPRETREREPRPAAQQPAREQEPRPAAEQPAREREPRAAKEEPARDRGDDAATLTSSTRRRRRRGADEAVGEPGAAAPDATATPTAGSPHAPVSTTREAREAREDADDARDARDENMTTLYVNVGRRDGVRAGDLARLVREKAGLAREEIGRVRVRDKHTFVAVAPARADEVVRTLHGTTFQERELVVEPAKATRA